MNWLVLEDEPLQAEAMRSLLRLQFPEGRVDMARNSDELGRALQGKRYEGALVDVLIDGVPVFELLPDMTALAEHLVFVTGYDRFLLQAFEVHAADYLLKPVEPDRLRKAVEKVLQRHLDSRDAERFRSLQATLKDGRLLALAVPTASGYQLLRIPDIVAVEADRSYCRIHLANRQTLIISNSLAWVEERLAGQGFLRVHRSWLVHPQHVSEFVRRKGTTLLMWGGLSVAVSRQYQERMLDWLRRHAGLEL